MKYAFRFFSILGLVFAVMPLSAQNRPVGGRERNGASDLRRNALIINIDARVLDEDKTVTWKQTENKITIPGRPVGINLVGSNVVVAVQFTPFIRRGQSVLVAQSQIWIENPEKGISYYTSIQTIPMELGEPIHFFPLGNSGQPNSSIEIILIVNPHETSNAESSEQ